MTLTDNTWGLYIPGSTLAVDHTAIVGPNGVGPRGGPGGASGAVQMVRSSIDVTSPSGDSLATTQTTLDSSRLDGGTVFFPRMSSSPYRTAVSRGSPWTAATPA